jgi:hypothetical protein
MLAETLRAASDSLGAPNLTVATRAQMTAITAYCNEQLFDHEATRRASAEFVQCQLKAPGRLSLEVNDVLARSS